jgi:sulfur-oxidizing protein SoxA
VNIRTYPLLVTWLLLSAPCAGFEPVSGYAFMGRETQQMQDDEFENPGMLMVQQGAALFNEKRVDEAYACSSCHGEDGEGLDKSRIAAYPVVDGNLGGVVPLQSRINYCWEIRMDRFPHDYDHPELIALETFVRNLAHGQTIAVETGGPADELLQQAEMIYNTRYGQLDMSCYHCHDQHRGQRLRGQILTQGQASGFPEYRLGQGRVTSLHQRLRECFISFRADPFEPGSREFKLLELYLMSRANGLKIETPAVRY